MGEEIQLVCKAILFGFLKPFCEFVGCKGHRQVFGDRYTRSEHLDGSIKEAHTVESGMKEVVDEDGKCKEDDHADALWVGALPAWTRFRV